jgi:hypothetical protein
VSAVCATSICASILFLAQSCERLRKMVNIF